MPKPPDPPTDPHNALFERTFRTPENAASHFKATLPQALAERIDWSTLSLAPGSYIDEELRGLHSDLLFEARTKEGEDLCIYVLFEHQSTNDGLMAFRLLRYIIRIWTQHLEALPKGAPRRLPPVVPVVLYHGQERWTARQELLELIEAPAALAAELEPYLPRMRYLLQDYSPEGQTTFAGRALVQLTLFLFRHARSPDFWQRLRAWRSVFARMRQEEEDPDGATEATLRYIVHVPEEKPPAGITQEIRSLIGPDSEEKLMSLAKMWLEEGFEKGMEKGLDQALEHNREQFIKLLRHRYGELASAVVQRVQKASQAELDTWGPRLFSAPTAEAVFEEPT